MAAVATLQLIKQQMCWPHLWAASCSGFDARQSIVPNFIPFKKSNSFVKHEDSHVGVVVNTIAQKLALPCKKTWPYTRVGRENDGELDSMIPCKFIRDLRQFVYSFRELTISLQYANERYV